MIFHSGPTGMSGLLRQKGVKDSSYTLSAVHTLVPCLSSTEMEESWVRTCSYCVASDGICVMSEIRPSLFFFTPLCEHKRGKPENKTSNRQSCRTKFLNSSSESLIARFHQSSFCPRLLTLPAYLLNSQERDVGPYSAKK